MKKRISKLLISILTGIVLLCSVVPATPARAVEPWYEQSFATFYTKVYNGDNPNEIFGERYTAAQVEWVFWGFLSMIINLPMAIGCGSPAPLVNLFGGNISNVLSSCHPFGIGADAGTGAKLANEVKNKNLLALVFADRPFSGITYVKNIGRNLHIIPEAKAAGPGFGYGALEPILPVWTAVRNVAYVFFVIVILVMSFMIMFRVKISPQAVITVQSALPKIAMAMILVTFSYAIAGFLIDLMYVVIGLFSLIIGGIAGGNVGQMFTNMTNPSWGILGVIGFYVVFTLLGFASVVRGVFLSTGAPGGPVVNDPGAFIHTVGATTLLSVLLAIVFVIIVIAALFVGFKIAWMLLRALINIILLTIAAPLIFALGTISSGFGFSSWVRDMIGNLAVFPIVGVLFSLSFMFLASVIKANFPTDNIPFINDYAVNSLLIGNGNTSVNSAGWPPFVALPGITDQRPWIYLIISIGLFFLIPKSADIIRSMIEGKGIGGHGSAIGEALLGAAAIAGLPLGQRMTQSQIAQKAHLETKIREAESKGTASGYADAEEYRKQLSQLELGTQLRSNVLGQLRDSFK